MARLFKGLVQKLTGNSVVRKNVGTDPFGNVYYELSENPNKPPKRMVLPFHSYCQRLFLGGIQGPNP